MNWGSLSDDHKNVFKKEINCQGPRNVHTCMRINVGGRVYKGRAGYQSWWASCFSCCVVSVRDLYFETCSCLIDPSCLTITLPADCTRPAYSLPILPVYYPYLLFVYNQQSTHWKLCLSSYGSTCLLCPTGPPVPTQLAWLLLPLTHPNCGTGTKPCNRLVYCIKLTCFQEPLSTLHVPHGAPSSSRSLF